MKQIIDISSKRISLLEFVFLAFILLGIIVIMTQGIGLLGDLRMPFSSIFGFIIVGFLAQMIDGTLGMAYGVSTTTFLLTIGMSPAMASASVHTAEVFTTLVSGLSHLRLGNVKKRMVLTLLIPGVLGGILGVHILSSIPGDKIKPFVSFYLLFMGVLIIIKALRKRQKEKEITKGLIPLGFIGGLCDAIGGGGWGPVVASTLVANGHTPRFVIGTVNFVEFFVTSAQAVAFVLLLGWGNYWKVILGLIIGGIIAAPLSAYICGRISTQKLMLGVGALIMVLSLKTLLLMF